MEALFADVLSKVAVSAAPGTPLYQLAELFQLPLLAPFHVEFAAKAEGAVSWVSSAASTARAAVMDFAGWSGLFVFMVYSAFVARGSYDFVLSSDHARESAPEIQTTTQSLAC